MALVALALFGSAQGVQVPTLHAVSLTRGNAISRSSSARSIGTATFTNNSADTTRIAAVRVQLRSFRQPVAPYEIQCFFTAKDPSKQRYIYDAVKAPSSAIFDEIDIFGRDLFGGSTSVDQATATDRITGTTSEGDPVSGTLKTTVTLTTTVPGAKLEGWIVRVISGGRVVRLDASLQELKTFAERESALLDGIATQLPARP